MHSSGEVSRGSPAMSVFTSAVASTWKWDVGGEIWVFFLSPPLAGEQLSYLGSPFLSHAYILSP